MMYMLFIKMFTIQATLRGWQRLLLESINAIVDIVEITVMRRFVLIHFISTLPTSLESSNSNVQVTEFVQMALAFATVFGEAKVAVSTSGPVVKAIYYLTSP